MGGVREGRDRISSLEIGERIYSNKEERMISSSKMHGTRWNTKSKIHGHKEKFHSKGTENFKKIIAETFLDLWNSNPDIGRIWNSNGQDQKRTSQCHI